MRLLIAIILISFLPIPGSGQSFYSRNFTIDDGLPSNSIRSIYKDSRGFMWIGTEAGLVKYDGVDFEIFNTRNGLAGNKIWSIDEDDNGNLWFACWGNGISYFDGQRFTNYYEKDGLTDNWTRTILTSSKFDCVVIGTNRGFSVLKDSTFYNFNVENRSLEKEVIITGIKENDSCIGVYDFSRFHYCIYFDHGEPYIKRNYLNGINKYGVSSVFEAKNGGAYFGWGREGIIKSTSSGIIEAPDIGQVFGMSEDNHGNIWAASWNGGGISPPGGLFKYSDGIAERYNSKLGIKSILGWCTYFDTLQNVLWYGTLDNGIYKIPLQNFEHYHPSFFHEKTLTVKEISLDEKNHLWVLTDSAIYLLNNDEIISILKLDDFIEAAGAVKNEYEKPKNFISVNLDSKNQVWVSVRHVGLFKVHSNRNNEIEFVTPEIRSQFLFNEKDEIIIIGHWQSSIRIYKLMKNEISKTTLGHEHLRIYATKAFNAKNETWFFSRTFGVFIEKNGEIICLNERDTTINDIVNDACMDDEGFIYLGGNDGRIEVIDQDLKNKIYEIDLPDLKVPVLWLEMVSNHLFAGYADGLRIFNIDHLFDPVTPDSRLFTKIEGYDVDQVYESIVDKENNIWLATNNGLVKLFSGELLTTKQFSLKTIFKGVEIFSERIEWSEYAEIDNWSGLPIKKPLLHADQNNISIYFQTLNYLNPEKDLYYYMMAGVDKDWKGPITKNYVVYPNLSPGKYKFLVKSTNSNSGLESSIAFFEFDIPAPWYKKWWFILLVVLTLLSISISIINKRIRILKSREAEKREIASKISDLETMALQAQMNPHFIFNSLNSIQKFVLDNDVDQALKYISSFSKVIRTTLEQVNKKFIALDEELEYLENYIELEKMRFDKECNFSINIDPKIDPGSLSIPPMILQPIIENAIKHGISTLEEKGKISLQIVLMNSDTFKCIIQDNGIGRKASLYTLSRQKVKKESKGLKIVQERIGFLNKPHSKKYFVHIIDLYDDHDHPKGTSVEITLPV